MNTRKAENPDSLKLLMYFLTQYSEHNNLDRDITKWTTEDVKDIPHQHKAYDCGIFMSYYAEFLARDEPITFDCNDMPYLRKRMTYEIISNEIMLNSCRPTLCTFSLELYMGGSPGDVSEIV